MMKIPIMIKKENKEDCSHMCPFRSTNYEEYDGGIEMCNLFNQELWHNAYPGDQREQNACYECQKLYEQHEDE